MYSPPARTRRVAGFRAAAAFGVLFVTLSGSGTAQPPAVIPSVPPPGAAAPDKNGKDAIPEFTLGECVALAVERQPTLRATRSSQDSVAAGIHALNNIGRLGQLVSPDLGVRKQQAERGMIAAAADIQKTHNDLVHDVTRLYYTAVYARQVGVIAEDVVAQVELLTKIARDLAKAGAGNIGQNKVDAMSIGLEDARRLLRNARQGERQAYAALREAMSVQEGFGRFVVKDRELPEMKRNLDVPLTEDVVVELALCRRPELALAAAGADAFRLEVYAQSAVRFKKTVPTLAMGGDIKAREVPGTVRDLNLQYKPGAIIPEMPPQLVGNQADRVAKAMHLSHRADAVFEKARNLVRLEAENAFFEYDLAVENVSGGKAKFEAGKNLMKWVQDNFDNTKIDKDVLAASYVHAAKAQADYVETVHRHLLTLTNLERVTAGGICPSFPGR